MHCSKYRRYSITWSARASSDVGGTSRQTYIARIDERAFLDKPFWRE
jgi:hypothetical protein